VGADAGGRGEVRGRDYARSKGGGVGGASESEHSTGAESPLAILTGLSGTMGVIGAARTAAAPPAQGARNAQSLAAQWGQSAGMPAPACAIAATPGTPIGAWVP